MRIVTPDDGGVAVHAEVLHGAERDEALERTKGAAPRLRDYEQKTTRTIPVVVLRRRTEQEGPAAWGGAARVSSEPSSRRPATHPCRRHPRRSRPCTGETRGAGGLEPVATHCDSLTDRAACDTRLGRPRWIDFCGARAALDREAIGV